MKKRILSMILATVMVAAMLVGCGSAGSASSNKVGVAMPTKDLQRWNQDGANMQSQLEAAGYTVDLQFAENDVSLPVSEDIPSEWILFGQETVDEIFAGLTASDDSALPVLATTVRPYHWMSQYEGIAVNNESERIFNIEDLLSEKVSIEMSAEDGPQILIVHTHGTESYNSGSLNKYYTTDTHKWVEDAEKTSL